MGVIDWVREILQGNGQRSSRACDDKLTAHSIVATTEFKDNGGSCELSKSSVYEQKVGVHAKNLHKSAFVHLRAKPPAEIVIDGSNWEADIPVNTAASSAPSRTFRVERRQGATGTVDMEIEVWTTGTKVGPTGDYSKIPDRTNSTPAGALEFKYTLP